MYGDSVLRKYGEKPHVRDVVKVDILIIDYSFAHPSVSSPTYFCSLVRITSVVLHVVDISAWYYLSGLYN